MSMIWLRKYLWSLMLEPFSLSLKHVFRGDLNGPVREPSKIHPIQLEGFPLKNYVSEDFLGEANLRKKMLGSWRGHGAP